MHGNNHPQGKRTVILMIVLCILLHFLLIPVWMGLVFAQETTDQNTVVQELRKKVHKHHPNGSPANVSKPVVCATPNEIRKIVSEAGEIPVQQSGGISPDLSGKYLGTVVVLGVNARTGTWSIVEFISTEWACIIANGLGIEAVVSNNSKDI